MGWTDRIFSPTKQPKEEEEEWQLFDNIVTISPDIREKWNELQQLTPAQTTLVATVATVSLLIGFKAGRLQQPWKRFTTVQDIPNSYFDGPFLRGRCLSVSDGDTIRFRHAPTWFHSSTLQKGEKLSDSALPIRICTIDTPETAKFGNQGQPFGEEAKKKLSSLVLDKIVHVRLLQKDQYGRAVAEVRTGMWPMYRYADQIMLRAGLAEVYMGSGAVYGNLGKTKYLALQETAKSKGKGIWSDQTRESAAEYKARIKAESS